MKLKIQEMHTSNLFSILFPICIILSGYVVPGTGSTPLGAAVLGVLSVGILLTRKLPVGKLLFEEKMLILFSAYIIFNQMVVPVLFPDIRLNINLRVLLMTLLAIVTILVLPRRLNVSVVYKTYKFLGWISCLGIWLQAYQVYIKKGLTQMIILPFMNGLISEGTRSYITHGYARSRPSSLFTEPSAFCTFIAPLVIFELKNRNYLAAGIISLSMLLTTSTTGVFLVGAIWCYYLFFLLKKKSSKCLLVICLVIACGFVSSSSLFSSTLDKVVGTNLLRNERSASAITIFSQMPVIDKITGVGASNVSAYLTDTRINISMIDVTSQGYVSSAFGNLIMYGLAGGILFFVICGGMILKKTKWARLFGILILTLSFIQTISFNICGIEWFIMYWLMRDIEAKEKKNQQRQKTEWYMNYEGISHRVRTG